MRRASQAHHGMFLVTGPTGSGKTTTLYALLNGLADSERKILSIEDPVEYHFDHVVQTQVAPAIGLTFASTLRAFLRQDPDVLLVGEIRDAETAAVAVQAAMTGHLVLASVHANDALRVVPRLIDMGVEPYQLAAALLGAAAQRLARRLCQRCKGPAELTEAERGFLERHGVSDDGPFFTARGCTACGGRGTKGRLALSEVFLADETFLRTIARGAEQGALADQATALGLTSMAADGIEKARASLGPGGFLMARFNYTAAAPSGVRVAGSVEADDERDAFARLQRENLRPIRLTIASGRDQRGRVTLSAEAVAELASDLAELLLAGASMKNALAVMASASGDTSSGPAAQALSQEISKGAPLDEAFRTVLGSRYPFLPALIAAGEAAGNLPGALTTIAETIERDMEIAEQVVGALSYPGFVLSMTLGSVLLIVLFVVPALAPIIDEAGGQTSLIMAALLAVSRLLTEHPLLWTSVL
eukprot:gene20621-20539_t